MDFLVDNTTSGKENDCCGCDKKDENFRNALHLAIEYNAPLELILKLLDMAGRDGIFNKDHEGRNALQQTCAHCYSKNESPKEALRKMIKIGGRDLLLDKDNHGKNGLHHAMHQAPEEIILQVIEVGGREVVLHQDENGDNPLHTHTASDWQKDEEVISAIIQTGGREGLLQTNNRKNNPFDCYIEYLEYIGDSLNDDIFNCFIQHGGKEVLEHKNCDGQVPLRAFLQQIIDEFESNYHQFYEYEDYYNQFTETVSLLIQKGIEFQVGGEYGIGGLLFIRNTSEEIQDEVNEQEDSDESDEEDLDESEIGGLFDPDTNKDQQNEIYDNWDALILPALQEVMELPHNQNIPILHAAIMNKAPSRIIKDMVQNFTHSVNTADSSNRFPIDIAIEYKLQWNGGMKEIVHEFASAQQVPAINIGVKHGLEWENGMSNIFDEFGEARAINFLKLQHESTGLLPFMLAAVGNPYAYDLGTVFHLIKKSPNVVKENKNDSHDETTLRKRKRRHSGE